MVGGIDGMVRAHTSSAWRFWSFISCSMAMIAFRFALSSSFFAQVVDSVSVAVVTCMEALKVRRRPKKKQRAEAGIAELELAFLLHLVVNESDMNSALEL